ncbi:MAG: cupin domain-containing protein [Rubrobacteraceae bacterium]
MSDREGTEVQSHSFEDDGGIPNNPELPLLIYPQALPEEARDSSACKKLLAENGWGGAWTNGVFSYHHYHSNAHEVLAVVGGSASLIFGGPEGTTVEVEAGDVVVIPAGVGHCNAGSGGGFTVIGAYPKGQENYDLKTGEPDERPEALENIQQTRLPQADPLFGEEGPLIRHWAV